LGVCNLFVEYNFYVCPKWFYIHSW
jgi:hypothetical protein